MFARKFTHPVQRVSGQAVKLFVMGILEFLTYALIFSFCFGQFGKLPGFSGEVNIYLWDALAVILVFYWFGVKLMVEKKLKLPSLWGPILFFASVAFISLVNGKRWIGVGEWAAAAGYWVRWVIYAGVYFVVSDTKNHVMRYALRVTRVFITSGVVLAILGFVQLLVFPSLSNLDPSLGWDPHQGRLVSTWLDPNFVGAYFVLCLSLLMGKFFCFSGGSKQKLTNPNFKIHPSFAKATEGAPRSLGEVGQNPNVRNSKRLEHLNLGNLKLFRISDLGFRISLLTTCYLILFAALIFTFSRSAWAMLAIVIGVFGILKSRKLLILMFALFFSAYFFVPRVQTRLAGITDPADSASLRLISWQRTFEIIKKYPLIGVGFNAFRYAQKREGFFRDMRGVSTSSGHAGAGSDSSLLLVWATTGIFGLLAYLWLCGSIAWRALPKVGKGFADRRSQPIPQCPNFPEFDSFPSDAFPRPALGLALLAALVGLFAESNFINSLFFPPIVLWLWIVAGLVVD